MDKSSPIFWVQIEVDLVNRGNSSARNVYVKVDSNLGVPAQYVCDRQRWEAVRGSDSAFNALQTIHPEQQVPFLVNIAGSYGDSFDQEKLTVAFAIFAADAPQVRAEVTFEREELLQTVSGKKVERQASIVT
jgi:hypothetical protein